MSDDEPIQKEELEDLIESALYQNITQPIVRAICAHALIVREGTNGLIDTSKLYRNIDKLTNNVLWPPEEKD